jgi:uncharacterized membrane protein YczE
MNDGFRMGKWSVVVNVCSMICRHIPLSITNKLQSYTIFFIAVDVVHVSGGFSAHHQYFKLFTQHLVYVKLARCYR